MSITTESSLPVAADQQQNEVRRKRKRDDDVEEDGLTSIDRRPFSIQPDASAPWIKPRTFTPVCLIQRSQLPLAYLDNAQGSSRTFAAYVHLLETAHECEEIPTVLIVKDGLERRFYAVERVQARRYALCRLGTWVHDDGVLGITRRDVRPETAPRKRRVLHATNLTPWWAAAAVGSKEQTRNHTDSGCGPPRIAMLLSSGPTEARTTTEPITPLTDVPKLENVIDLDEPLGLKPASAAELFEELSRQYLDALYLTRTPLSYFVKGPIARIKAAFSNQSDCELRIPDLTEFIRGMVLSSAAMDQKYRVHLAEVIDQIPGLSSKRKKRKWKPKRDKAGFFSDERGYVEQWWQSADDGEASSSLETADAALRRHAQKLRNRETFLQIILILEVLALQAVSPRLSSLAASADAVQIRQETQTVAADKKPKRKKDIDFGTLLDTFVDRLCIWYSLESGSPAKHGSDGRGNAGSPDSDDLKDFCFEVIVPFYLSHVPEHAGPISKKLGGPDALSSRKRTSSSFHNKPGEPAVRRAPEKRLRKPLTRVSTDTLNRPGRPPMLHRSATDSNILEPLLKRETSEAPPSLASISVAKLNARRTAPDASRKRKSFLHQVSFGMREVDLSAMSQANETKMRKKAEVEEKLRDAITTLKKPNRALAVEELARIADESFAIAVSKGKGSGSGQWQRRPVEKGGSGVAATPRHVKATPARRRQHHMDDTAVVPSSAQMHCPPPGSTSRTPAVPQTRHRIRPAATVSETPSRGFAKCMPAGLAHVPGTLLASPTATRSVAIAQTPVRQPRMPSLADTPVARVVPPAKARAPTMMASEEGEARREDSGIVLQQIGGGQVYSALGWDDDEYEELA